MRPERPAALRRIVCALALATAISAAYAADDARPISDAERAAVQDAAAYLSRGPAAVYDELAASSPLKRLAKDEALQEIETRLGPIAGAHWQLQTVVPALANKMAVFNVDYPSGIDETVLLDMKQDGGAYRIANIRILAEKSASAPIFAPEEKVLTASVTGGTLPAAPAEKPVRPFALTAGLLAVAMAVGSAFLTSHSRGGARVLLASAVLAVIGATAIALRFDARFGLHEEAKPVATVKKDDGVPRLAALLPLRRAIAAGGADVDAVYRSTTVAGSARDTADLWKAQWDLQQNKTDDVGKTLKRFASPSPIPLAEILRARVASYEGKEVDAVVAYERAVSLGPGRDGLWYETAQALSSLGYDDRARNYFRRLAKMGSRNANVYYSLAVIDAATNQEDDSEKELLKAWKLRPAERAQLVDTAVLWSVLRRPYVTTQIKLSDADEATFASQTVSSRAIALPAEATARVSGDYLDLQLGAQQLSVPGGAELAPPATPVVDATAWTRTEEQKALEDLPQLLAAPRTPGSFAQPVLRLRITRAGEALANHNAWPQLLQLTEGLSPKWENVPAELLFLRHVALQRMQRNDEAKELLYSLAASPVVKRKNEPQSMLQLAEMMASVDEYDNAIKLMDRAAAVKPNPMIDDRVRQIQMNKRLATKYSSLKTTHFEIHYPDDVTELFAQQFGQVMEAEYTRLQKTIPTPNFRPVVVNLLWWRDFRSTYTGSDFILGFYQGKITVPLAGIPAFEPEIVAILSHELSHAMIAQATNDQAPHWFQEGLAQRIEMRDFHPNAFNMYTDDKLLSVSLIDAVLKGSPDPEMISEGYVEAQTIIRFIEATYGTEGVAKMLQAFRDGATTDEAIMKVSGLTTAAFDTKLRAWGRSGAKVFENPPPVRYDGTDDGSLRWSKRSALETKSDRRNG